MGTLTKQEGDGRIAALNSLIAEKEREKAEKEREKARLMLENKKLRQKQGNKFINDKEEEYKELSNEIKELKLALCFAWYYCRGDGQQVVEQELQKQLIVNMKEQLRMRQLIENSRSDYGILRVKCTGSPKQKKLTKIPEEQLPVHYISLGK